MSTVSISQFQIPDWRHGGSTGKLRLYASQTFTDSVGVPHIHGTVGSKRGFYQEIAITISGSTITVPAFNTYSTTDARPGGEATTITGVLFDSKGGKRETLFQSWRIPETPSATTWSALQTFNQANPRINKPENVLSDIETAALIQSIAGTLNDASATIKGRTRLSLAPVSASDPVAVGDNDPRLLSSFVSADYATLNAAIAAIGATPGALLITAADFPSGTSCTVPSTLVINWGETGSLLVANSQTVTIKSDSRFWPIRKIFNNALSGQGTISFLGNTVAKEFFPQWFGVTADGTTDESATMQAALTAAGTRGGTLYCPPGNYNFTSAVLTIPRGVTLQGSWEFPPVHNGVMSTGPLPTDGSGTTFLVRVGSGSAGGTPFITMPGTSNGSAAVRGITFYYPDQPVGAATPTAYPWTIYIANGANCAVENIQLINPYQAIKSDGGGRLNVRNILGQAIYRGLYLGHNFDVSRLENIHWISVWQAPGTATTTWQLSNAIAFEFGRVDDANIVNCFAYGYWYGWVMSLEAASAFGAAGALWASMTNCGADGCAIGIWIKEVQGGGEFTVSGGGGAGPGLTISGFTWSGNATGISMTDGVPMAILLGASARGFTGYVTVDNSIFGAMQSECVHIITGSGALSISGSQFFAYSLRAVSSDTTTGGVPVGLVLSGNQFLRESGSSGAHVLADGAVRGIMSGNRLVATGAGATVTNTSDSGRFVVGADNSYW